MKKRKLQTCCYAKNRNTIMLNGNHSQEEMIKSVKKGIFAVSFGGGQVGITSGKFVLIVQRLMKL